MRIAVASDHGALELKAEVKKFLEEMGHSVNDHGTYSLDSCDYPDFAYSACKELQKGLVDRAIVMCTTGIGVSIVANKVNGVRCALVTNVDDAIMTRKHNDTNCLAMGAKNVSPELARKIVSVWLTQEFEGGRHLRRVQKIKEVEESEKNE